MITFQPQIACDAANRAFTENSPYPVIAPWVPFNQREFSVDFAAYTSRVDWTVGYAQTGMFAVITIATPQKQVFSIRVPARQGYDTLVGILSAPHNYG
jgi:hypothetical protein